MIVVSPSGRKNFEKAFGGQSDAADNSNFSFIEKKLSTEDIPDLIDSIKSKL
jgi:hypothetical protein